MLKRGYTYVLTCLSFVLINSCTKYEEVKESENPSITYSMITPINIKEFKDSVQITIKYKDGNGDLGDENPDELNILC